MAALAGSAEGGSGVTPSLLAVLLPPRPTEGSRALAERFARELGAIVLERRGRTVSDVLREGYKGVITVGAARPAYHTEPGRVPFFYHPGLAKNRIGSLLRGEPDTFARAAGLEPGLAVLDATLGKAVDATVAAHVVGSTGRVVGVEGHPVVAALVRQGLEAASVPGKALAAAMDRVEVHAGDHLSFMRSLDARSFDVVYFDPFFDEQVRGSADMAGLRDVGWHGGVSLEALAEACRVARARVVHKVRTDRASPETVAEWPLVRGKRRIGYRVLELR